MSSPSWRQRAPSSPLELELELELGLEQRALGQTQSRKRTSLMKFVPMEEDFGRQLLFGQPWRRKREEPKLSARVVFRRREGRVGGSASAECSCFRGRERPVCLAQTRGQRAILGPRTSSGPALNFGRFIRPVYWRLLSSRVLCALISLINFVRSRALAAAPYRPSLGQPSPAKRPARRYNRNLKPSGKSSGPKLAPAGQSSGLACWPACWPLCGLFAG